MTGKLYGTLGPSCADPDTLRRGWKACAAPRLRRAFPVTCSSTCRAPSCASARFSRR